MRWSPVVVAALFAMSLPAYAQEQEVELQPGDELEIEVEEEQGEDEPAVEEEEEVEYQTEAIGSERLPRAAFPWWVEGRGGITIPTADLADVVDVGFGAGLSFGYYFSPAFAIFANGDWGTLSGITEGSVDLPDQGLFNYYLALGYDLAWMDPAFSVLLFAGAGATTFYVDEVDNNDTNFALDFGLKLYFWFVDQVAITVHGAADLVFLTDEVRLVDEADTRWLFPVHLGLALRF